MPAQDLDEPFDLCDRDGNLLGQVKPRGAVHRDGDWHRALHLWVVIARRAQPVVVFQRRSLAKDTHPGLVDVSVAGHLRAGESVEEALRESEEEIGLGVALADAFDIGARRVEKPVPAGVDREVQTVLGTVTDAMFSRLRPHPDEVAALYAAPLADALALARGERTDVVVAALDPDGRLTSATLRDDDFVPNDGAYRLRCLEALDARLRGETFARLTLG